MSSPCEDVEPLIAALAEGSASPAAAGAVRAHLALCAGCKQVAFDLGVGESDFAELATVDPGLYVRGEEIGRGGVGRILCARDRRLGRMVALKELLDENLRARFEGEARLTARLQHPAIVSVYEAGRWPSGEPFYAMEYVEGRSLDRVIAATRTFAERVALLPTLIAVAEAMAYAHSVGVIHRDLKPQNILVGSFGETVVIDWGLAKDLWADSDDPSPPQSPLGPTDALDLTRAGAGTPMYMPPEQAAGGAVDARADVYSLGATLYHVLMGRPPLAGEPVDPAVPAELAAVIAKAMAPEPDDRYASAAELADELRRFQTGRLLTTHHYTPGQLLARFLRRNRALVALASVSFLVLAAVGVISFRSIVRARDRAEKERAVAESERAGAEREAARGALLAGDPLQAAARLRQSLEIEDSTLTRALYASVSAQPLVMSRQLQGSGYQVAFSPSGGELGVATYDGATGAVWLLSLRTWTARRFEAEDQILSMAFSGDGKLVVAGLWNGHVAAFDVASGQARVLTGHRGMVKSVDASADGSLIVSGAGDREVRLWRGGEARVLEGHSARVTAVALSPDASRVASASEDGTVRVWDTASGSSTLVFPEHHAAVKGVRFTPDGRSLVSAGADGTIRLWDARSGVTLRVFRGPVGPIESVCVSSNGTTVAGGGFDGSVWVWDLASGATRAVFERAHTPSASSVAFSPDGRLLASTDRDGALRVWEPGRAGKRPPLRGFAAVVAAAMSRDGRWVAAPTGKSLLLTGVTSGRVEATLHTDGGGLRSLAFGPDFIVAGSEKSNLLVWRLGGAPEPRVLTGHTDLVVALAVSGDGRTIVSGSMDRTARVWDAATGEQRAIFAERGDPIYSVALAPSEPVGAVGRGDGTVRLWSTEDGRELQVLSGHHAAVRGLAFRRQDGALLSASDDGTVRLWEKEKRATGYASRVVARDEGSVYKVAWHPDGRRAALASSSGKARIWELDGERSVTLVGHHAEVNMVGFSPDGRLTFTAGDDGALRLWETDTGRPVWRAPLLIAGASVELFTHNGWESLDAGAPAGHGAWRDLLPEARLAAQSADERTLCIARDASVEMWDLAADQRRFSSSLSGAQQILALGDACVVLAGGVAWRVDAGGATRLVDRATAAAADGGAVLIAHGDSIDRVTGAARDEVGAGGPTVTALLPLPDGLVVGFQNGGIERRPGDGGPVVEFTDALVRTVAGSVVTLARGPRDTVIAGFAHGAIGIWHASGGQRLDVMHIHGPVRHLRYRQGRLYAASDLGDWVVLDLGVFELGYCELMRTVWQGIPVLWEGGLPVARTAPATHVCAR